jgi:hypothetical protein
VRTEAMKFLVSTALTVALVLAAHGLGAFS